jgi:hypothetical protein
MLTRGKGTPRESTGNQQATVTKTTTRKVKVLTQSIGKAGPGNNQGERADMDVDAEDSADEIVPNTPLDVAVARAIADLRSAVAEMKAEQAVFRADTNRRLARIEEEMAAQRSSVGPGVSTEEMLNAVKCLRGDLESEWTRKGDVITKAMSALSDRVEAMKKEGLQGGGPAGSYKAAVEGGNRGPLVVNTDGYGELSRGGNKGNRMVDWSRNAVVLSAPKGFIIGENDGQRAGGFNEKVVGKLPLPNGMFYKPEAVAVRPMGSRRDSHTATWVVVFGNERDVGKMLAYKPAIARHLDLNCIFIRPFFSEGHMQARKALMNKAKDMATAQGFQNWGFRWEGALKGYVYQEGGSEKLPIAWEGGKVVEGDTNRGRA